MKNGASGEAEVIVVGGGLAGLAAATYLARAGRAVTVLERSSQLGGRAITNKLGEFYFNLGPHALYRKGAAAKVLRELGVDFDGKLPPVSGYALRDGALHFVSQSPWWFATNRLLSAGAKLEAARKLVSIRTMDPTKVQHLTLREWLDQNVRHPEVRELLCALVRVASYANDTERLSAGLAIHQLQFASRGVYYLRHGWQTLVDGLHKAALAAGARIEMGATVVRIERDDAARGVRLADGAIRPASAVIIAVSPQVAAELVERSDETPLREWADAAVPVRAACLDVGLQRLTRPKVTFVLGLDQPIYFSVHSRTAKLAPEGSAMIHIAKYLAMDDRTDPKETERELEAVLDLAQPGWRDELVERRFLPSMTVVNALATADCGGLAGRPGLEVPGVRNLYVAGDWVGTEGWLSDASMASAKRAAELILERPAENPSVRLAFEPSAVGAGRREG